MSYLQLVAVAVPFSLAVAAVAAPRLRVATAVTTATLGLAVLVATGIGWSRGLGEDPARGVVRLDAVTAIVLLLVCGLGAAVARFSRSYLRGDRGAGRYERFLLGTLAAVTSLVLANDLVVIAASWTVTSLCLHQLLTFHATRTPALVAAHKKFLVSRAADVCVLAATALVARTTGSVRLDDLRLAVEARETLPASLHVAAVLLVVAVMLKSAQLPFHGWLTQVMEAPTPVSALLHAGVVNLGGLVLIRLAPLVSRAPVAELALLVVGLTTTVVAALVSTTRVSVKVALAWSTIAQMGFMLVECALGAYHLALLHLVAHSFYKAHAFLRSGSAVEDFFARSAPGAPRAPDGVAAALGLGFAALVAAGMAALDRVVAARHTVGHDGAGVALAALLAVAMAPIAARALANGPRRSVGGLVRCVALSASLFAWHKLATACFADLAHPWASPVGWALVVVSFAASGALAAYLTARPRSALARRLHPPLFSGLYLDEVFTRLTFRLWPPRLVAPRVTSGPLHPTEILEV